MQLAKYLLDIREFTDAENGEALVARAFSRVDEERREKAGRMRPGRAQAASLGAGLLLQIAVREAFCPVGRNAIKRYSVNELLELLDEGPSAPLAYVYGQEGKPYFRDLPFYFNLSHSGDYVLCAISLEEIGADIQQHCGKDVGKLARRFFSGREASALERPGAEREELFYRLWARKEAYGKLTGKGIAGALEMDFLPGEAVPAGEGSVRGRAYAPPGADSAKGTMALWKNASGAGGAWTSETAVMPGGERLLWEEYDGIEGYSMALCRYGRQRPGERRTMAEKNGHR